MAKLKKPNPYAKKMISVKFADRGWWGSGPKTIKVAEGTTAIKLFHEMCSNQNFHDYNVEVNGDWATEGLVLLQGDLITVEFDMTSLLEGRP